MASRWSPYSERCTVWDSNGEIGEDCKESVRQRRLEGEVVGDLMNGKEEVLVCCCTNDVGRGNEAQRKDWRVS